MRFIKYLTVSMLLFLLFPNIANAQRIADLDFTSYTEKNEYKFKEASKLSSNIFWRQNFNVRGITGAYSPGIIYDSKEVNGKLYVAGAFDKNNGEEFNNFMVWDGQVWTNLGESIDGVVISLETIGENLLLAGSFTEESSGTKNLVTYDISTSAFSSYHENATNFDRAVWATMVKGDSLYVGGDFENIDGQPINGLALWDGNSWSDFNTRPGARIRSIFEQNTNIFVGGDFDTLDNKHIQNLAVYNGTTWSEFGGGANNTVVNIEEMDNSLYVMGYFDELGSNKIGGLGKWNGISWDGFSDTLSGVWDIEMYEGSLYATFEFPSSSSDKDLQAFARYSGSSWEPVGNYFELAGITLSRYADKLFVGGILLNPNPHAHSGYALWDGTSYQKFGGNKEFDGVLGLTGAFAQDENYLYAGGGTYSFGDIVSRNVSRWNGTEWEEMGDELTGSVYDLLDDGNIVYAATNNGIFAWNKSTESWTTVDSTDGAVVSLAKAGSNLYAAGYFENINGQPFSRIARWNGSSWNAVGEGLNDAVFALAIHNGELYAGGRFTDRAELYARGVEHIAKWDGAEWTGLAYGLNSDVQTLFSSDSVLYIGGAFTADSGNSDPTKTYNHIAYWDGSEFQKIGNGVDGRVNSINSYKGKIYLGGYFTTVGIFGANIATWDNQSLEAFESTDGGVFAITSHREELVIGGYFSEIGQQIVSQGIAFWNGTAVPETVTLISPSDQESGLSPAEVEFSWEPADFAEEYVLELATDNSFSENFETITETGNSLNVNNLSGETTYYWRVKGLNSNGDGNYSATQTFSTAINVSNEDASGIPITFELQQNYPNPFNPNTQIHYQIPEQSKVTLTIYNILGQRIANLVNEVKPAGNYTFNFDASDFSSGIYIYRLNAGGKSFTKKMTLIK